MPDNPTPTKWDCVELRYHLEQAQLHAAKIILDRRFDEDTSADYLTIYAKLVLLCKEMGSILPYTLDEEK